MTNPYFWRGPVRDWDRFAGRRDEIARIYAAIDAPKPECISLIGERKVGKSSLLRHIADERTRKTLRGAGEHAIFASPHLVGYQPADSHQFLETLRLSVLDSTPRGLLSRLHTARGRRRDRSLRRIEEDLAGVLSEIASAGYKVIYLIDNAESMLLRARLDSSVLDFMRFLADSSAHNLSYIIASRRSLRHISRSLEASGFHNIFAVSVLSLLNRGEAEEVIRVPTAATGKPFSDDEVEMILEMSGLHPMFIQVVAQCSFDCRRASGTLDVSSVLQESVVQLRDVMLDLWDDRTPDERLVLATVAGGDATYRGDATKALIERGLIIPDGAGHRCFGGLFESFVRGQANLDGLLSIAPKLCDNGGFARLRVALEEAPFGNAGADVYHQVVFECLRAIFGETLRRPTKEQRIHNGRKRIDIIFDNRAESGFFLDLSRRHSILAPYVICECKNAVLDSDNRAFDQLIGRFNDQLGHFGLLVCRRIRRRETIIERCKDAITSGAYILVLVDTDLIRLLELASRNERDEIDDFLSERLREVLL